MAIDDQPARDGLPAGRGQTGRGAAGRCDSGRLPPGARSSTRRARRRRRRRHDPRPTGVGGRPPRRGLRARRARAGRGRRSRSCSIVSRSGAGRRPPITSLVRDVLARVGAVLDAAGIPWLVFKGPVLSSSVYCDSGMRRYSDLDVLVPPDRFADAVAAMEDANYANPVTSWAPQVYFRSGAIAFSVGRDQRRPALARGLQVPGSALVQHRPRPVVRQAATRSTSPAIHARRSTRSTRCSTSRSTPPARVAIASSG